MFFRLINQLAKQEGVTEQIKAKNQLLWVQKMNSTVNFRNSSQFDSTLANRSHFISLSYCSFEIRHADL